VASAIELRDGRELAYAEYGDPGGRPILYFHGVPGSRLEGEPFDEAYRELGVRVVAIDRPGFGGSTHARGRRLLDWPGDVAALADSLGLERFLVAGYSSGGKYALACAHALPDRVEAAGVVSGVGPPDTPGFRDGLSRNDRLTMTLGTRARPLALAYWGLARAMVNRRPDSFIAELEKEASEADRAVLADPEVRALVVATSREALRPGVRGLVQDIVIQARPWGFRLEEVGVPTRIWHGDRDEIVPLHHSTHAAGRIPDAELTTFEGEGHLLAGRFPEIAAELSGAQSNR
jgi:pimeloyl-ACP methyl ester carboxylesterase